MVKEYKNFRRIYKDAVKFIERYSSLDNIRNNISMDILRSYFIVSCISNKQQLLLDTKSKFVKFSVDSLVKNLCHHPEIKYDDYKLISKIITESRNTILTGNSHIKIIKIINKRMYSVIIKTTKKRDEKLSFIF